MGTDIHMMVEIRENGKWSAVDVLIDCEDCHGTGKTSDTSKAPPESDVAAGKPCWFCKATGKVRGWDYRCYDVFSMLAGVRNGYGFAGVPTGEGFVPIAAPRGIPEDASDATKDAYNRVGDNWLGDHSFSHVTLAELLAYSWERECVKTGVLSLEEFRVWDRTGGRPESYCGGISGPKVVHVDNHEMRKMLAAGADESGNDWTKPTHYTSVMWGEKYKDRAGSFYETFLPALQALGRDPNDVRLVFGFDS